MRTGYFLQLFHMRAGRFEHQLFGGSGVKCNLHQSIAAHGANRLDSTLTKGRMGNYITLAQLQKTCCGSSASPCGSSQRLLSRLSPFRITADTGSARRTGGTVAAITAAKQTITGLVLHHLKQVSLWKKPSTMLFHGMTK